MDRRLLLEKHTAKMGRGGVPVIVTYSSHLPNIGKILRDKTCLLFRSDSLKNVFDTDMFVSHKRGTNLNPRPGRPFSITRPGRGGVDANPPGVSKLSIVPLRDEDQSIAHDEYSRLVVYF